MNNVFGRLGAVVVLGMLASACGGGDEDAKPPQTPTPPPPVAVVDTTPPPVATAAPTPAKPTLPELEATALKTILDGENAHDTAKIGAAYTDDAVVTVAGVPPTTNKADMAAMLQHHFDTFKNAKFWATRTFTKNDMVAVEWGWSGTDTGGMMGKPATEKAAGSMGFSVFWFSPEGLVKKENRYLDFGTLMSQLGAGKHPAAVPAMPTTGSVEAHVAKGTPDEDKSVAVATAMYAALDAKKQDDFLATIDDAGDFVDNAGPMSGVTTKKADAKKFFGMWTKAFPDQKNTITNSFGVEDFVVVESSMAGTQKGAIGPLAASKKPVTLHSAEIYQIANGKMVHGWSYSNGAELMMQIGAMKMPGDKAPDMGKAAGASKGAAGKTATTPAPKK